MRNTYLVLQSTIVLILCCGLWTPPCRGELLLRWTFDEAASGDQNAMNRGTAPGADGIFGGGATRTSDTPGGASRAAADLVLLENGIVSAADSSAVDGLDQITITAWINLQGDPVGNDRIASLQDGTSNFNGFSMNINAPVAPDPYTADSFRLGMFIGGTTAFAFGHSETIVNYGGEWIFVATTYDGLSDFENLVFYVGTETLEVLEHFFPVTAAAGPIAPVEPGTGFHLGRTDAAPEANTSLEGFIDDVRVYDEALTIAQLEAIRLEGLMPSPLGIPGDYNGNGAVEQADLDLVLLNWGQDGTPPPNGWVNDLPVGAIDQEELDGVLLNWGNTAGLGAAQAVPEPSALGLMAVLLAAFFAPRFRRL